MSARLFLTSINVLLGLLPRLLPGLSLGLLLATSCALSPSALASNDMVPSTLVVEREHLLKERQELLEDRANLNSKLNSLISSRNQLDKALTGNPLNRQALYDARSRLAMQIGKMQQWLDQTERSLIDTDKDLNVVEGEIKSLACLNAPTM